MNKLAAAEGLSSAITSAPRHAVVSVQPGQLSINASRWFRNRSAGTRDSILPIMGAFWEVK